MVTREFFCDIEKKFRATIVKLDSQKGITNFNLMTDFNKELQLNYNLAIINPKNL